MGTSTLNRRRPVMKYGELGDGCCVRLPKWYRMESKARKATVPRTAVAALQVASRSDLGRRAMAVATQTRVEPTYTTSRLGQPIGTRCPTRSLRQKVASRPRRNTLTNSRTQI